ncbi:hypothetical protein ACS6GG_22390 [Enterobacter bugandensis]|uniref:hypothetical protein n=1 Tax=Enterobacter bugandensis TaxID=881260 RepID=UPI003F443FFE
MSTITKERLTELSRRENVGAILGEEIAELARIALASLEAEPVADVVAWSSPNEERTCDVRLRRHDINPGPLFTAPPAPADKNPLREFAMEYIESWGLGMAGDSSLLASARKAIADSEILQPAPVSVPDERYQHLSELYHAQEKRLFKLAQRIKGSAFDKYAHSPSQAIDVLESEIFGEREDEACRAAMLQGAENAESRCTIQAAPNLDSSPKIAESRCSNSPVIPDGWADMLQRWLVFGRGMQNAGSQLPLNLIAETEAMLAAAPQQEAKNV